MGFLEEQMARDIHVNPLKAIREWCVQHCMNGSFKLVRNCNDFRGCPLWPFRHGRNPNRAKPTAKQIAARRVNARFLKNQKGEGE